MAPTQWKDDNGSVWIARIGTPFSDLVHTLIDRSQYNGIFLPGFKNISMVKSQSQTNQGDYGISHIDHVALAYQPGTAVAALDFYSKCLGMCRILKSVTNNGYSGFQHFLCSEEDSEEGMTVEGQKGGLKTLVAACSSDEKFSFKFVLVEPLPSSAELKGKRKNQVQEFIDFNGGPGVQHMALHTDNIVPTVANTKRNGVEVISIPSTYYDNIFGNETSRKALEEHRLKREDLQELGILVDVTKENNLLLQTFTSPLQDRPTFFLEVISRKGSDGFGKRTIKALFEAVERLQEQSSS
jgi:4-hydroxyphenylpyruvate dioxygenase